jgi:cytochrome c553
VAAALSDSGIEAAVTYVGTFTARTPPMTVSGDLAHGRQLYAPCAACHGDKGQGNESLHAPALSGSTDWYLVTQLQNYRTGLRGSDPQDLDGQRMRAVTATLGDDAAINDVVAYIDTLR